MGAKEKAMALRAQGFNCAQCVLGALGDYTGLDEKTALAISVGFGGGARCGELCGTVSGATMAFGMAYPWNDPEDAAAKAKVSKMTMVFTKQFGESFGCMRCFDLKRAGHPCNELIFWAAEKAEEILKNNK